MSMNLHSKLGSFLRIKNKVLKKLHAVRAVNDATHSREDSVKANVGDLKLAPRPGFFAVLDSTRLSCD